MQEPMIFGPSREEISVMTIALPSGKIIEIKRGSTYRTEDPEEIEFLSKLSGVFCRKVTDSEFRTWAMAKLDSMPSVDNPQIKTVEDVAEYLWKDPIERLVMDHLKNLGYIVTKPDEPNGDANIAEALDSIEPSPADSPDEVVEPVTEEKQETPKGKSRKKASDQK